MNDDELRDLQERVQLIEDMARTPGWSMLLDRARTTLVARQVRIVQGKCQDHEDYVKECAFGDGMEFMMRLPGIVSQELEVALSARYPEEPENPE